MIFTATITVVTFASSSSDTKTHGKQVNVNANNETYGSLSDVNTAGEEPDLIAAQGIDGTLGYVRFKDFNGGDMPKTTMEAVARNKIANEDSIIPLYAADGRTVIGSFEISGSSVIEFNGDNISVEDYKQMLNE